MTFITTFAQRSEFEKAKGQLDSLGLPHEVLSPEPGYRVVGEPCLVIEPSVRVDIAGGGATSFTTSGWVDYRAPEAAVPSQEPAAFDEDVFGRAAIMVLAPCVADPARIRVIAHLSADLTEVFPYLNTEMREANYNIHGPTFTFMDRYRMVSVYRRRIAVAKADEVVDAWRVLESVRVRANEVWARRSEIEPSYELRERPPAVEILKRLPRTNCGLCGEATCLAFSVRVWSGKADVSLCRPVFRGEATHLKDALIEVCSGLSISGT